MRALLAFTTIAGTLILSSGLSAEDGLPKPKELFEQLDLNKDGKLTLAEIPEEQVRFFERLVRRADQNEDGELTLTEFSKGHADDESPKLPLNGLGGPGGRGGANLKQRFEMMDRNKDGKVTRDEIPEMAKERLNKLFERLGKSELSLDDLRKLDPMPPAQGSNGRPNGEGPRGPLFARLLDADRDGRISKQEWAKAGELFAELDRNDDGELDMFELMGPPPDEMAMRPDAMPPKDGPPGGPERPGNGRAFFGRMDRDGDGKISRDEAPERLKDRFDQVDENQDGSLSPEELRKLAPGGRPNSSSGKPRPKRPQAE